MYIVMWLAQLPIQWVRRGCFSGDEAEGSEAYHFFFCAAAQRGPWPPHSRGL
jgi:hypothetical protein